MCQLCLNSERKEASAFTKKSNRAFAEKFGIDLEDAYNSEWELARSGLIKSCENIQITDENGNVTWDLRPYEFLKAKAVADSVHPSLWLNGKCNIEAGVFEVLPEKIYQVRGFDVANLTLVRSKTGWIAIDVTTTVEAARAGLKATEEALGENIRDHIRAVIISHSHADHYGGLKGVVDEERVKNGQVRIYVPAVFDEETVKENVFAGTAMMHRGKYQFGADVAPGILGKVSTGIGLSTANGTISYIQPTDFIKEDTVLTIDGLTVEFQLTPGTEAPAEMNNYFPKYRAFWAAENCTGTLHNLYPIRGAQLRDAANWWRFTEIAFERYGKKSDVVFQSHNWPHRNTDEHPHAVEEYLKNNAAIYKFIHDQTLLYANMGKLPKEIAKLIQIPDELARVWYTRPYYGSVELNSRAVYCKYLGFYNGNPNELDPLTEVEEAKLFVSYVGSEERVLKLAAEDFAKGEYRRSAKAATYVVYVNPRNQAARYLAADSFEQLGYSSESGIWRNAYLCGAFELRNGTQNRARRFEKDGKNDIIRNMTPRMVLDYLGIVTDGNQLSHREEKFSLQFVEPEAQGGVTYLGKPAKVIGEFRIHIYRGAVLYYEGKTDEELPVVKATKSAILGIIGGQLEQVKPLIETEREDILDFIGQAVVNLSEHSQFALIEPNG